MSFAIEGRSIGGAGRGSFAMDKAELLREFSRYLDELRAGGYLGNEFRVTWDQSDEPHTFVRDLTIRDARICRICQDHESTAIHIPERRVTGRELLVRAASGTRTAQIAGSIPRKEIS